MESPFLLLMPSYNQSHYIVDAVNSVLAQDDPNWELWIVDNSSDSTPEVMKQFNDSRIHFHHIPERMDPGSCLNWMLKHATGKMFSYIHTDNNLHVSYVSKMRNALEGKALGLAYCNMRTIDDSGKYLGVFLRGEFNLARMLSIDPLGAPFSATVELAKQLGGFSSNDFADDVRFCTSAYGLANYHYIREPLLDYRIHTGSRTAEAGGSKNIQKILTNLMPKLFTTLEQRGINPLKLMEQEIRECLDDMELHVEDFWHRKLSVSVPAWWQGTPRLDHFFFFGLLNLPGFTFKHGRPPLRLLIRCEDPNVTIFPWTTFRIRIRMLKLRHHLRRMSRKTQLLLLPWSCMKLGVAFDDKVLVRIASLDTRTIWAARQLELSLGWKPLIDPCITNPPRWLKWGRATGAEPLLSLESEILLKKPVSKSSTITPKADII